MSAKNTAYDRPFSKIQDAFESEELNHIRFIQRHANIADALTKHNPKMHKPLTMVVTTGVLELPNHQPCELDSTTWT